MTSTRACFESFKHACIEYFTFLDRSDLRYTTSGWTLQGHDFEVWLSKSCTAVLGVLQQHPAHVPLGLVITKMKLQLACSTKNAQAAHHAPAMHDIKSGCNTRHGVKSSKATARECTSSTPCTCNA